MRKVIFITPDYASHYNPLIPLAEEFRARGYEIIFATGLRLASDVKSKGYRHVHLRLQESDISNLKLLKKMSWYDKEQATKISKKGMLEVLKHLAEEREKHLLWEPGLVHKQIKGMVFKERPDIIISIQLAYNATLALKALEFPFINFVSGHPMEFPNKKMIQGYQYYLPSFIKVGKKDLYNLKETCEYAQSKFTKKYNKNLALLNKQVRPEVNAYAAGSEIMTIFNYPLQIIRSNYDHDPQTSYYIGSSVRTEKLDDSLKKWIEGRDESLPTVFVSLGSYFSVRDDVLQKIAQALKKRNLNVVFATGITDKKKIGRTPDNWIVREEFPLVALLGYCDLVISHGGNNIFTECFYHKTPLLVSPFSTDQFYASADIEKCGFGLAYDPNTTSVEVIGNKIDEIINNLDNYESSFKRYPESLISQEIIDNCEKRIYGE